MKPDIDRPRLVCRRARVWQPDIDDEAVFRVLRLDVSKQGLIPKRQILTVAPGTADIFVPPVMM